MGFEGARRLTNSVRYALLPLARALVGGALVACAQGEQLGEEGGGVTTDGGQMGTPSPTSTATTTSGTGGGGVPITGGAPAAGSGGTPASGGMPSMATGGVANSGGTGGTGSTSAGGAAGTLEQQCLALEQQTTCTTCACARCTELVLDCFASGDTARDTACREIVDCARANFCSNVDCYCGDPPASDTCSTMAQGPCVAEIQAAAGSTDIAVVGGYQQDPDHAVGRASLLGACAASNCAAECGL